MTGRTAEEKAGEFRDADWLQGGEWYWVAEWQAPHADWDHDHCVFCHVRIAGPEWVDGLRSGWRWDGPADEPGNYDMVCAECFDDLRNTFGWRVVAPPSSQAGG